MHVDVRYAYRSLLAGLFVINDAVAFKQEAAFLVRDARGLGGDDSGGGGLTETNNAFCGFPG